MKTFDIWKLIGVAGAFAGAVVPIAVQAEVLFSASFETSPFTTNPGDGHSADGKWVVQQKAETIRATSEAGIARDGGRALRLHTESGDHDIAGSGEMERNDVYMAQPGGAPVIFGEGAEHWWSHSILFPDDFAIPTWHMYVVAGFHHEGCCGQGNFHINFQQRDNTREYGDLIFRGYGGTQDQGEYRATIFAGGTEPPISKNLWYDFVHHVRWSSGSDGFFNAWVRKDGELYYRRVLAHQGPTLYTGQGVYLKLANGHVPVCDPYPACIGTHSPSSVIHDRVVQGTTAEDVKDASAPLEFWYEENDPSVVATGPWVLRGSEVAEFSGKFAGSANAGGTSAAFSFTGTAVNWMGLKCNLCGIATVSIDGGPEMQVDTAGAAAPGTPGLKSEPVFTASGLAPGSHTLQITVTGTTTSGDAHIVVDRFDVH
jgi:hypothetical protein